METTRFNYEAQMRGLYEHLAQQDAKIVNQLECIERLNISNNNKTVNGNVQNEVVKDGNGITRVCFFKKIWGTKLNKKLMNY